MESFSNKEGTVVVRRMIGAVKEHKQYLSDIDGEIGDGDHGINMNKGFTLAEKALDEEESDLSHSLNTLGKILMMKIGGSMGPLYGKIFKSMGKTFAGHDRVDKGLFGEALANVKKDLEVLSPARVGDKTLVDALYPAVDAYLEAAGSGNFSDSLEAMKKAAEQGRDATRDMVAKIGRSSRLGERSRGVIDAGAASSALLLGEMADAIQELTGKT